MRSLVVGVIVLTAVGCHPNDASNLRARLQPCHLDSLPEQVLCGVVHVHEDRDRGAGDRIPIHIAVLPPLRRDAAPDPLVVLAGGPGQGARDYAVVFGRLFHAVRRTRAIVLVDLRGTGQSAPLSCFATRDELASLEAGRDAFLGAGAACLDELQRDPRHYTHRFALADLDDMRQWLGYEQINLWGGSWGTRAALLYALTYPDAVRRVVLDGAVALDMEFPHAVARDAQRAFDRLVTRCAADSACAAAFPDPHRDLSRLLARLEQAPATVHLAHPRTHVRQPLTLTRDVVAEIVRVALYTTVDASRVLAMVRRAADGDFAPLVAQFVQSTSQSTDSMALGATLAILCSEDMPRVTQANFAEAAQGTFLRTAYADAWAARCERWPVGHPLPSDLPQTSEVPALILSGAEDPITPPSAGEAMRLWFPDSEHIIVNGAAHNTSFSGCLPDVIARFLDAAPLDAACVNHLPLPPAVTSLAGGRP